MKKLVLAATFFFLAACSPERKPVVAPKDSAATVDTTTPISPAAVTGLWLDKDEVAAYRTTRKLTEDTCDESASTQMPSLSIALFGKDGAIYQYDPSRPVRPEDRLMHFRNGVLESDEKDVGAHTTDLRMTLHRTRTGVRIHIHGKDSETGKLGDADLEFTKITESEARELSHLDQLCAHTAPANRLNELAPGAGQLIVRDGPNGDQIFDLKESSGNPVTCAVSEDGSHVYMSSLRKRPDGNYEVDGLSVIFPVGTDLRGQSAIPAKLGDSTSAVQVSVQVPGDKDGIYTGNCQAWLRKSSFIIDADVRCDAERISTSTQEHRRLSLEGRLACSRNGVPLKK